MDSGKHDLQKDVGSTHAPPEGGSLGFQMLSASPMDGTGSAQSRRPPALTLEASRDRQGSWNTLRPGSGQAPDRDQAVQAEPDGEVAGYRARMLAKVGGDQSRGIAFTDAELADFLSHAKGLGFVQADIEAILAVKVRKPAVQCETLMDVADCLSKKRSNKRIRFNEGWDFMKAYRAAQDAMLNGNALEPEVYLDAEYTESHRKAFTGKASYLLPGDLFDWFVNPETTDKANLGYKGALYVSSQAEIDRVLLESNGDIGKVELLLGIQPGRWQGKNGLWRVDINDPEIKGMRIPNGFEVSANEYWTPGGFTSGGAQEAVLNEVPRLPVNHTFKKVID